MMLHPSKRNYWAHTWALLIAVLFCSLFPLYSNYILEREIDFLVYKVSACMFVILCLPSIILIIRYTNINGKTRVSFNSDNFIIQSNGSSKKINLSEVEYVVIKVTIPAYFNALRLFATDSFFYAKVHLKSGKSLIITTLLDLELIQTINYFKGQVPIEKKARLVCWPS